MNQEVQEVQHVEDDYLVPSAYEGQGVADADGIVRFTHDNGKHYFTVEAEDSSVLFRSEGYASVASRDNGAESFLKNKDNAKRYAVEETHGFFYVVVKAGNNQEIARSFPLEERVAAESYIPKTSGEEVEAVVETPSVIAAPEAAIVEETPAPVVEAVVETPAPVVEAVVETPAPVVEAVVETPAVVVEPAILVAAPTPAPAPVVEPVEIGRAHV